MEQDTRGAVRSGVRRPAGPGWTAEPTTTRARRLWLAAVAATSVLALAAIVTCAVDGISLVAYASLYVPIVLAAYRYLWRGALFGCGLALAYLATMLVAFGGDPSTLIAAATRTLVFIGVSAGVALLATGVSDAQRRITAQRDLALELDDAHTIDQAAAAVCALTSVPCIDAVIVFVNEGDGVYRLAASAGLSDEFVKRVGTVDPASPQAALFSSDTVCWDTYPRLMAKWGVTDDQVRVAEGLAGMGRLPIMDEDITLGSLFVASRSRYFIRSTTQTVVELATAQVGAAMARVRAMQAMHRQHARTEVLYEAARELTETVDFDGVLAHVAKQAAQAVGSDQCHIWDYDQEADTQTCMAVFAQDPEDGDRRPDRGMVLSLGDYPDARAVMQGERVWELRLSDPATPLAERRLMQRLGIKASLHVPLRHAGRPIGRLVLVETRSERHFTADEVRLVQTLGEHAAAALENARLYESLEDQNRRLEALLESARVLTSSMDVQEILRETVRRAAQAVGSPQCVLYDYDDPHESLLRRAAWQDPAAEVEAVVEPELPMIPGGPYWRALHEQTTIAERVSDPLMDRACRDIMEDRAQRSVLSVPLVFSGTPIGLLSIVESRRDRHFTTGEVRLAEALAAQAAIAINNARLYRAVQEQAIHDGLTGLYNHRYFYGRLSQEITRAHRYGEPAALLMLDLDDFKMVNDSYGHPVGDEILRAVAQVIRTQARRDIDLAARYGGEEFALLLPNTPVDRGTLEPLPGRERAAAQETWASGEVLSRARQSAAARHAGGGWEAAASGPLPWRPDGALAIAERIRAMVAASTYAVEVVPGGVRVTVSIGVAGWSDDPSFGANDLVAKADQALYAAKQAGKDRCVVYRERRVSA